MGEVEHDGDVGCCGCILIVLSVLLCCIFFPFSLFGIVKVIDEFERAVILRLGRVKSEGAAGPGMIFILPCVDEMIKVDLRTLSHDVPRQEILTKDSVTVAVDAVVYYRVQDPVMSVCNVNDAFRSTHLLAATTLRNVLGMKVMTEILAEREEIANTMQGMLDEATDDWGIKVERVEVKDVRLPLQLQRAMAAEAEATREAKAKVVAAEGEQNASRALKEAGDIIMESPTAMTLRYLQTLGQMAAGKDSTIFFPLPINMMDLYMDKGKGSSGGKSASSSSSKLSKKKEPEAPPQAPVVKEKVPPPIVEEKSAPPPNVQQQYLQAEINAQPPPEVVMPQNQQNDAFQRIEMENVQRRNGSPSSMPDVEETERRVNIERDMTMESVHL